MEQARVTDAKEDVQRCVPFYIEKEEKVRWKGADLNVREGSPTVTPWKTYKD